MAEDIDLRRPLLIRTAIASHLNAPIAALAEALRFPTDPREMTPAQQEVVLERLDHYVRLHDLELWRTKQVSDFAGGVWAQVFGPAYNHLIVPFLLIGELCKVTLFILLIILLLSRPRAEKAQPKDIASSRIPAETVVQ